MFIEISVYYLILLNSNSIQFFRSLYRIENNIIDRYMRYSTEKIWVFIKCNIHCIVCMFVKSEN